MDIVPNDWDFFLGYVYPSGVEDVITDYKSHKVVVKGEKADPLQVLAIIQKKSHRQVELLSPITKPQTEEPQKLEEKEAPNLEEKKGEVLSLSLYTPPLHLLYDQHLNLFT